MKYLTRTTGAKFVRIASIAGLALAAFVSAGPVHATQYNEGEYTVWDNSKYYIDDQSGGYPTYLQTVSNMSSTNSRMIWNVDWNFSNSGVNYGLKYPAVHMGWHWGYPAHYPSTTTGLPTQLAAGKTVSSVWNFAFANTPDNNWSGYDVAWDCWFHWNGAPTWQNQPNYELMIWPYSNSQPVGSKLENVTIGGQAYELWGGPVNSWYTFSFRKVNQTQSISLKISDFTNYLINDNNTAVKNTGFNKWVYLTGVEAGVENYNGSGHLYNWWYQSDVY